MTDIETLKKSILESDDVNELYAIELKLIDIGDDYHGWIKLALTDSEHELLQSGFARLKTLRDICRDRITDIKAGSDYYFEQTFRLAAKTMLPPEIYKVIADQARKGRKALLADKEHLRANRRKWIIVKQSNQ